jgi:hypothetical protein
MAPMSEVKTVAGFLIVTTLTILADCRGGPRALEDSVF